MTENDTLNAWSKQYCPEVTGTWAVFKGYSTEMCKGDGYAGRCYYKADGKSEIYLNERLENHALWSRVALWHEFCHAWAYTVGDNPTDWKKPHLSRLMKKPLYFLAQFPMAMIWLML